MKLPLCARCNQRRNPADLVRGKCIACRRHRCTKHQPGNATCYQACSCRCDDCRRGQSRYRSRLAHLGKLTVDASMARAHLARMLACGMAITEVARLTGCSASDLRKIVDGRRTRLRASTAVKILAGRPRSPEVGYRPICGVQRRIQALMALGWTCEQIGAAAGHSRGWASELLRQEGSVTVATLRAVSAVYDLLWDQAPPDSIGARRARAKAARSGWPPPLAWDDDKIDNPARRPCGVRKVA